MSMIVTANTRMHVCMHLLFTSLSVNIIFENHVYYYAHAYNQPASL